MKNYVIWLGLLALTPGISCAQNLRPGYFGETITHYGLKGAYEVPLASPVSSRNAAKRQLYGLLGIAGYRQLYVDELQPFGERGYHFKSNLV